VFFLLSGSAEQIKHKDIWNLVIEKNLQNNVKIIDRIDDVRKIISITDIGILSSRYSEFICRIAMEFMAFRKPVVAPDLNVIPEVIENEKSGYIYDLNNSRMASDFILYLANNDSHRKQMGKMGSDRIKNLYSLEYFRKELDNVLMELE
jgi:glycosyltransferase involved in cell wall biosynthesis